MRTYVNVNKVIGIAIVVGFGIWMFKKSVDASKAEKELNEYKKSKVDTEEIDNAIDEATVKNDKIESPADRAEAREILYSMKDEITHANTKDDIDSALRRFRDTCNGFLVNESIVTKSMIEFHKKRMEKAAITKRETRAENLKREEIQAYAGAFRDVIKTVGIYL